MSQPVHELSVSDDPADYRLHTDPKMLGPDGNLCHPWARGHLQPGVVTTTALTRISKETSPLIDPDDPAPEEPTIEYRPRVCAGCGKPLPEDPTWPLLLDARPARVRGLIDCRRRLRRRRGSSR